MSELIDQSADPKPTVRRQKNMLVVHRMHAMQKIESMEAGLRASRWATLLFCALLSCCVVWFLIQSIAANLVYVDSTIVLTEAHVDGRKLIEVDPAPSPFIDVITFYNNLAAGNVTAEMLRHPLFWIAILALATIIAYLVEGRGENVSKEALDVSDPQFQDHQNRYFANPFEASRMVETDHPDGESVFGDDVPRNIRRLLSWWNAPTVPERSSLENGLLEVKRFLGEDAYFWMQCCAALPRPHWHAAVYIGRTMTNHAGESLYTFENADKLDSLPWFVTETMPNWLRKHLLAGLERDDQQELRSVLQALLVSTSQGAKNDLAYEIVKQHRLFMRANANTLTGRVLEQTRDGSELRDPLFHDFMSRGVDEDFYAAKLKSSTETQPRAGESDYARIIFVSRWLGRIGWSLAGIIVLGIAVYLLFLSGYGGFRLSLKPPLGVITVGDSRKAPPATFFWLAEGRQHLIEVDSKDFKSHHLILEVQGRVIADLDAFALTHMRAGRLRELPQDPGDTAAEAVLPDESGEVIEEPVESPDQTLQTPAETQEILDELPTDFLDLPTESEPVTEPALEIDLDFDDPPAAEEPASPATDVPEEPGAEDSASAAPDPPPPSSTHVAVENRSEPSPQISEGSERFSFAEKESPSADDTAFLDVLNDLDEIQPQKLPDELSLKNLSAEDIQMQLEQLTLDTGFGIIPRTYGVGLAAAPGTRAVEILVQGEALQIEIDDNFLRQIYRIRQVIPRNLPAPQPVLATTADSTEEGQVTDE